MIKKRFFFVRHAETVWNQQHLCQGQTDISLSEMGLKQAKLFANSLCNWQLDCIISSPLDRALTTAKEIYKLHPKLELHVVKQLSERCWGELEGISSKEMYKIEQLEEQDPSYCPSKGVEKRYDFRQRICQGLIRAQSYHPHPLIVSHGRVFVEICFILGMLPIRQIPNCELIEIVPDANAWRANAIKHLIRPL